MIAWYFPQQRGNNLLDLPVHNAKRSDTELVDSRHTQVLRCAYDFRKFLDSLFEISGAINPDLSHKGRTKTP